MQACRLFEQNQCVTQWTSGPVDRVGVSLLGHMGVGRCGHTRSHFGPCGQRAPGGSTQVRSRPLEQTPCVSPHFKAHRKTAPDRPAQSVIVHGLYSVAHSKQTHTRTCNINLPATPPARSVPKDRREWGGDGATACAAWQVVVGGEPAAERPPWLAGAPEVAARRCAGGVSLPVRPRPVSGAGGPM